MRDFLTAPAVLAALVGVALLQHWLFVPKPAACERPRKELILSLGELIEDGTKRTNIEHYSGFRVTVARFGDDDYGLRACKTNADGGEECYEHHYAIRFGQGSAIGGAK